jgi:hypothetical protein
MTGAEMKDIRYALSEAIGRQLTLSDMAKLCGLKDWARHPDGRPGNGHKRYRQWEEDAEPIPGPAAALLSLYLAGLNYDDSCEYVEDPATFMLNDIRRRLYG